MYDVPPEPRRIPHSKLHQQADQRPRLPPREHKGEKFDGQETYDTPPSNIKAIDVVYDIPPQVCRDARPSDSVDSNLDRFSSGSDNSSIGEMIDPALLGELHLELDSAKDMLVKNEQEVYRAIDKLTLLYTSPHQDNYLENAKLAVYRLNECNQDLLKIIKGSIGNALRCGEGKLAKRLNKQLEPIDKASSIVNDTWELMKLGQWKADEGGKNSMQQLSTVAVTLMEDIKHISSIIKGHAHLIFKKSQSIEGNGKLSEDDEKTPVQERPLPDLPRKDNIDNLYQNETSDWLEDYDYVNLESKESVEREHQAIKDSLPTTLQKSYDNLIKQSHLNVDSDHKKALQKTGTGNTNDNTSNRKNNQGSIHIDINDQQVLKFYAGQADIHLQHLNTAIDAFLHTIENNQPPKVFIAHSKFVILSAHKLVYIGDTVHRNVLNKEIRTCVLNCSNALCDAMKNTVALAKTAALQFPSVIAVQAMVDAFVAVSHLANNLKQAIHRNH